MDRPSTRELDWRDVNELLALGFTRTSLETQVEMCIRSG